MDKTLPFVKQLPIVSKGDALFRIEAINSKKVSCLGEVILIRPMSYTVLTLGAAISGGLILVFLCFCSYTKRVTVNGQLTPAAGLMKIYPVQSGVVLSKFASEGKTVQKGDILYTLSSERRSSALGETQSAISDHIKYRSRLYESEISKTREINKDEFIAHNNKIKNLEQQLRGINDQIELQESRIRIATVGVERYTELLNKSYVSNEQLEVKQADVLDQNSRLKSLVRDRTLIEQELFLEKNNLLALSAKQENRLAQISRFLSNSNQELIENEARRQIVISSPQHGVVTGAVAEPGQFVDGTYPLLSLVPIHSNLIANLYVPSSAIGFTRPGDAVLLRYQAFPYQKFGQHFGKIISVSKTALPVRELNLIGGGVPGLDIAKMQEMYYLIIVQLDTQYLMAYGKSQPLQTGMVLEADILQDKRRLVEWIFEPIYGLKGKWK